jgi:hypothetical protein
MAGIDERWNGSERRLAAHLWFTMLSSATWFFRPAQMKVACHAEPCRLVRKRGARLLADRLPVDLDAEHEQFLLRLAKLSAVNVMLLSYREPGLS